MRGVMISGALALAVSGCMATVSQADKMKALLEPWVGRNVGDYAAGRGQPQSQFDIAKGKRVFEWHLSDRAPVVAVPVNNSLIVAGGNIRACDVTLVATSAKAQPQLSDWIIGEYNWRGAC